MVLPWRLMALDADRVKKTSTQTKKVEILHNVSYPLPYHTERQSVSGETGVRSRTRSAATGGQHFITSPGLFDRNAESRTMGRMAISVRRSSPASPYNGCYGNSISVPTGVRTKGVWSGVLFSVETTWRFHQELFWHQYWGTCRWSRWLESTDHLDCTDHSE